VSTLYYSRCEALNVDHQRGGNSWSYERLFVIAVSGSTQLFGVAMEVESHRLEILSRVLARLTGFDRGDKVLKLLNGC
jgi:hypothetical protein